VFAHPILGNTDDAGWIGAAILTHHRDWADIEQWYPAPNPSLDFEEGLEPLRSEMTNDFFAGACRVLRQGIWPSFAAHWDVRPEWSDAVAYDWIPGDPVLELRQVFTQVRTTMEDLQRRRLPDPRLLTGTFLRGATILADHSGSAHEDLRMIEELSSPDRARIALGIESTNSLYKHQQDASARRGHAILTAPTGSGKTEAAILWSAEQAQDTGALPVIYYVLPYQASLNAMYLRLNGKFENAATLQHSRAVQSIYRQLLDKKYTGLEAQIAAKREKDLGRLYVKALRISTPYQLLKGAFQLKGHEALWTAAAGGLFVFDEIHAYEPARLGIMLETLRYLSGALGGRVLIMSATLPSYLRAVLADVLTNVSDIRADPTTLEMFRRHEFRLLQAELTDESVIDRIVNDYRAGMAVLVVATTVGRAQELRRRIAIQAQCEPQLLHGRFHADDRTKKEQEILLKRGRDTDRSAGLILVATQVVEVSLNVDFDTLYSDPAPLEALLQRFGRVNRFRTVPTCVVHVCRAIPDRCPVYLETLVRSSVAVLEKVDGSVIDEAGVQSMLDEIYDGQRAVRLQHQITTAMRRFRTEVLETCRPFASDDSIESMFDELFEGYEVLPVRFQSEYRRRVNEEPFLAPGLLVPITRGQYWKLRRDGRLRSDEGVLIADCRYESEGLEIDAPAHEDGV
jgi:CRISPR-associated endonuclease/helicase Cas3